MADPANELFPADMMGYRIEGRIGRGAFAAVFKAFCDSKQQEVAIKVIELENEYSQEDIFGKVMNESTIMLQLNHKNIVSSLACFTHDAEVWIVMPMLVASCADILRTAYPNGFDSESWIARIFSDVLAGLEYIHKQNMVHRDLKSGNILLDAFGVARIADFGVSGSLVNELTAQKRLTVTGTPCWMAPEVAEHADGHDSKADIWSMGITCLELMSGKPPYHNFTAVKAMMKILNDEPPTVMRFVRKQTSPEIRKFVDSCLKKDPKKRKTAKELQQNKFLLTAVTHDELAHLLNLQADPNPYIQTINSDALPQSLVHRESQVPEHQNNIEWAFTVETEQNLVNLVREAHAMKEASNEGDFVEVFDDGKWFLTQVVSVGGLEEGLQVRFANNHTMWILNNTVRSSRMNQVYAVCSSKFEEYRQGGFNIVPENFMTMLLEMTMEDPVIKPWQLDEPNEEIVQNLVAKHSMWIIKNASRAVSSPLPAPQAAKVAPGVSRGRNSWATVMTNPTNNLNVVAPMQQQTGQSPTFEEDDSNLFDSPGVTTSPAPAQDAEAARAAEAERMAAMIQQNMAALRGAPAPDTENSRVEQRGKFTVIHDGQ